MADGIFITLEGVEGSGKTTQAAILADELRRRGLRVTLTREPGGTRAGEAIRAIFLDPAVSLGVASELLLVLADRAQHVREKLRPALDAGEIVDLQTATPTRPPPTRAMGAGWTSSWSTSSTVSPATGSGPLSLSCSTVRSRLD